MDIIKRKNLRAKKGKKNWKRNLDASELQELFEDQAADKAQLTFQAKQKKQHKKGEKLQFIIDENPQSSLVQKLDPNRFKKKTTPEHLKSKIEKRLAKKLLQNKMRQANLSEKNKSHTRNDAGSDYQKSLKQKLETTVTHNVKDDGNDNSQKSQISEQIWDDQQQQQNNNNSQQQLQQHQKQKTISNRLREVKHIINPSNGLSYNPSSKAYKEHINNIIDQEIKNEQQFVPDSSKQIEKAKKKMLNSEQNQKKKRIRPKSLDKQLQFEMEEQIRQEKMQNHQFTLIKKYQKELSEQEKQQKAREEFKQQILLKEQSLNKEGIVQKPPRLGRKKYQMKGEDFLLEEDFAENLRNIKPAGNLLRDQYDSIFRRGILEVNDPTKKLKQKSHVPKYKYQQSYTEKREEQDDWAEIEKALAIHK